MISILICLYFFICSLSFLSDSFRLIGGKNIGGKNGIVNCILNFYFFF